MLPEFVGNAAAAAAQNAYATKGKSLTVMAVGLDLLLKRRC